MTLILLWIRYLSNSLQILTKYQRTAMLTQHCGRPVLMQDSEYAHTIQPRS